jgi:hypothetical protein
MAIKRMLHKMGGAQEHMVVPEFTFATNVGTAASPSPTNPADLLAQMIVDAWQNVNFTFTSGGTSYTQKLGDQLRERHPQTQLPTQKAVDCATQYIQKKVNLVLSRAVVITEAEHSNDYVLQSDDEIAFVLPDYTRVLSTASGTPLLQAAQFLMACTPNGI